RREGEDCRRGTTIARAGARVDAGLVALLAACGVAEVDVHGAPRVALVVTGDEVRPLSGRALGPHAVFDAHSSFLRAALREFGIDPVLVARSRDRAAALRAAIGRALDRADLVLVTGGVSMGERDLVRPVLESLGVETIFRGVSQKPGKPLYFGARDRALVFGLPGNPVSTVVCYCEYVRPCIARMMGIRERGGTRTAELDGDGLAPLPRQTRFVRGTIRRRSGTWTVRPVIPEGSHRYGPFRESDCLIALPPGAPTKIRSRARVTIHPFPWKKP
ncbi:MAG: molybdopterin molybdotransferase MoeA, partial [Bacteroidota bacterium]